MPKYIFTDGRSKAPITVSALRGPYDSIEEGIKSKFQELEKIKIGDKEMIEFHISYRKLNLLITYIEHYRTQYQKDYWKKSLCNTLFKIYEIFPDKSPKLISDKIIFAAFEPILHEYEVMLTDV